ncbi:MAG TPA: SUMF1/EgtB/PvdO family nonheme iron enzyme, partial [Spirochaetota bacterium]|nr:SUMF1/EgtB/PvdO family nonheme iron enzyme [Spirochaetota bacterium]
TSGTDGLVSYTNAVAGDAQVVTVGGGSGQPIVVTVNPEFDGQDIGTIPVVEDGYSFKVTSKVTASDSGYLYGNDFNTYTVTVDIKNIGNARCLTSLYEVIPDAGLSVTSGALSGNFSTIEVGATRTLTFGVRYGTLMDEYKDVKLAVKITDAATVRTWVDYVVLRFHKRPVPLKITSQNLDGVNTATLKGFVVHPDNRSARFTVPSAGSAILYVPWSSRAYQMIFSGAGASTEMKYSFVVGTQTSDLGGTWTIPDINAFEPNNSEAAKTAVTDGWIARRAYLNVDDIDFYSLDLTAMPGSVPVPTTTAVPDSAYGVAPDVTGTTAGAGIVTLTFSGNGHTGGTVPVAVSGTSGWVVTLPDVGTMERTGATFAGWNMMADGTGTTYPAGSSYTLTSSITLYARWTCIVTFDSQGGSAITPVTIVAGRKVTVPANPTGGVGSFVGWYKEDTCITAWDFAVDTVTVDVTLYAKWMSLADVSYRDVVSVPGGTYSQVPTYGNTFSHTITGFKMGKYEVTYELWKVVHSWANANGYQFANAGREGHDGTVGAALTSDKHEPVTYINWRDAIVWCNAYSQMEGKTPVYCTTSGYTTPIKNSQDGSYGSSWNTTDGSFDKPYVNWSATGYRLPTEGEWQYAASYKDGSSWTPYNYASGATADYNDATATGLVAWYSGNSDSSTKAVGTRTANALGIYDMSGNVFEFCWDFYQNLPTAAQNNYRGPASGSYRTKRGGSYLDNTGLQVGCRDAYYYPYSESDFYGFRIVCKQ